MIIDRIENLSAYASLHPNIAAAARFLSNHDIFELPHGRTDVDGDNVFINVSTNTLGNEEISWEAHKRYADIQVILNGEERFLWGTLTDLLPSPNQSDYYPCHAKDDVDFVLKNGQFVLFLPLEPHSPGNYIVKGEQTRKAVIKVKM